MYRSSFRTFPSFLNPRAHSAHTWTTLWSFRSFSSKTQSSFILSTITEQWKFSYRIFTYIQNEISFLDVSLYKVWLHCLLTIQKSVSQKSHNRLPFLIFFFFFFFCLFFVFCCCCFFFCFFFFCFFFTKKIYHKKSTQGNRIGET